MNKRGLKDFPRRTHSDKKLHYKEFNTAKNSSNGYQCDGYQRGMPSIVYKIFDKKSSGAAVKSGIMWNQQLSEKLHKQIIRKFGKYTHLLKTILWGVIQANMQLISKYNKGFCFSLRGIDIYSKYAWLFLQKNKKGITVNNAFQKSLDLVNLVANQTKYV